MKEDKIIQNINVLLKILHNVHNIGGLYVLENKKCLKFLHRC